MQKIRAGIISDNTAHYQKVLDQQLMISYLDNGDATSNVESNPRTPLSKRWDIKEQGAKGSDGGEDSQNKRGGNMST